MSSHQSFLLHHSLCPNRILPPTLKHSFQSNYQIQILVIIISILIISTVFIQSANPHPMQNRRLFISLPESNRPHIITNTPSRTRCDHWPNRQGFVTTLRATELHRIIILWIWNNFYHFTTYYHQLQLSPLHLSRRHPKLTNYPAQLLIKSLTSLLLSSSAMSSVS